jgi:hypothetical protein
MKRGMGQGGWRWTEYKGEGGVDDTERLAGMAESSHDQWSGDGEGAA